jgi:carbonic anhydrase
VVFLLLELALVISVTAHAAKRASGVPGQDPDASWAELMNGNRHFVADNWTLPNITSAKRHELYQFGQTPKAAIVACSDSRVPPEYLFEEGLGDIFLVRLAGTVVDRQGLGSLEYAVEHLGVTLIVVMGHHHCGAVTAALAQAKSGTPVEQASESNIWTIVQSILPAAQYAIQQHPTDTEEQLETAVQENVRHQCDTIITNSKLIRDAVAAHQIQIRTAESYLDTGVVEELNYTCVVDEATRFPKPTAASATTAATVSTASSCLFGIVLVVFGMCAVALL